MGTRAWLVALLALTLSCQDAEIGERPGTEPPRELNTGGPSGAGGSAGTGTGAGADAGSDAGSDAGADTGSDAGADAGTDPCAGGPLSTPIPSCNPIPAPGTGDIHADCVARINQLRWECQGLPPLMRWTDGESCTDSNAEYDSVNGVHASFSDMPCGSGARAQNECPGWPSNDHVITGCLQSMWDEGPEDGNPDTVNGHYETMAASTYTRVACGFYTTASGDVWAVQNFD